MFDFGPYTYTGFVRPELLRNEHPSRITGVGRTKGRPSDKDSRYAAQKDRKRTKMKKASRRRNRKRGK